MNLLSFFSPIRFIVATTAILSTSLMNPKLGLTQVPELITAEEKFILSQWLHLDLSLDGVASVLFFEALDTLEGQGTSLIYNGNYSLTIDDLGNATGNSSSIVSGLYFGAPLEIELQSEFLDDNLGLIPIDNNLGINSDVHKLGIAPKQVKFKSQGFWQQTEFPVRGTPPESKKFTDDGMVKRDPKNNSMGDLELTIEHRSGKEKLTGKFKYGKRGDDAVIKGNVSVPKEESTRVEILLPKNPTESFNSLIISKITPQRGREKKKTYILKNYCKVIEQEQVVNIQSTMIDGSTECQLTADIVTVPEYSSNFSFLAFGILGAGSILLRNKKKEQNSCKLSCI